MQDGNILVFETIGNCTHFSHPRTAYVNVNVSHSLNIESLINISCEELAKVVRHKHASTADPYGLIATIRSVATRVSCNQTLTGALFYEGVGVQASGIMELRTSSDFFNHKS